MLMGKLRMNLVDQTNEFMKKRTDLKVNIMAKGQVRPAP